MNLVKQNPVIEAVDSFVAKIAPTYKVLLILVGIVWFASWAALFLQIA